MAQSTTVGGGIGSAYKANRAMAGIETPAEDAPAQAPAAPSEERTRLQGEVLAGLADGVVRLTAEHAKLAEAIGGNTVLLNRLSDSELSIYAASAAAGYDNQMRREMGPAQSEGMDPGDPLYISMRDVARRRRVEANLKPLDFEAFVLRGFVTQTIPISTNFNVTLSTISTLHTLWIENMIFHIEGVSEAQYRHEAALYQIAAALVAINGTPMEGDLSKLASDSKTTRENFEAVIRARKEYIAARPAQFLDELNTQFAWFSGRVRRMLQGDVLGRMGN